MLKNKVKKTFIKIICVKIVKSYNGGNYIVKIKGNYESFKLNNNEKYCASFKMLIKCEENIWDEYYQYINSSINKNNQNNLELGNSLNYDNDNEKSGENDDIIDKNIFNNVS